MVEKAYDAVKGAVEEGYEVVMEKVGGMVGGKKRK